MAPSSQILGQIFSCTHHHQSRKMTSAEEEFEWRCRKCSSKIASFVICLCSATKKRGVFFSASAQRDSLLLLSQSPWGSEKAVGLQLAAVVGQRMGLEAYCLDLWVMEQASNNSSPRPWPLAGGGAIGQKQSFALEPEVLLSSDYQCDSSTCRIACVRFVLDVVGRGLLRLLSEGDWD